MTIYLASRSLISGWHYKIDINVYLKKKNLKVCIYVL